MTTCHIHSTRSLPDLRGLGTTTSIIRCSRAPAPTAQPGPSAVNIRRLRAVISSAAMAVRRVFQALTARSGIRSRPLTVASASVTRNRSSQQQQILNNLNSSVVDANGNVVDQVSGLPIALVNPQSALSNGVFRFDTARAGVTTELDRNTFGLFAFYRAPTGVGHADWQHHPCFRAAISTSRGVSLSWARSLTPRLNSNAILGYAAQNLRAVRGR